MVMVGNDHGASAHSMAGFLIARFNQPKNRGRLVAMKKFFTKKRVIISFVVVILYVVIGNAIAYKTQKPHAVEQPKQYEYAYMASKCQQGINNYKNIQKQISDSSTRLHEQTLKAVNSIDGQAGAYEQSQGTAYRKAIDEYTNAYNQDQITYEEWSRRVDALEPLTQNISDTNAMAITGSVQLLEDSKRAIEENQAKLLQIENDIKRLEACVNTATTTQDFNSTQVAELELLIANSSTKQ